MTPPRSALARFAPILLLGGAIVLGGGTRDAAAQGSSSAAGTSSVDTETRRRIDAAFAEWDRWDSPGAAVVVVRDGEVFYQRGHGSAQLEYSIPITPSTVFHVASVSKQFTCMVIDGLRVTGNRVRNVRFVRRP